MSDGKKIFTYSASPTSSKFHQSQAFIKALVGPVGCGKSVACCLELFRLASIQKPQKDGIRRSRFAIIRATYNELKTTTIKTWKDWFNPTIFGKFYEGFPLRHVVKVNDIEMEVIFLALSRAGDVDKLRSLEITGAWINEARELPYQVLEVAMERVGRYPSAKDAPVVKPTIILDTNPPDMDSWFYEFFEEKKPETAVVFKYIPAAIKNELGKWIVNTNRENQENVGADYYERLIKTNIENEEFIKVQLAGEYGSVYSGKPVYHEFNDKIHITDEQPYSNLPIYFGWDFGLTPACVFAQFLPDGRLLIFDEVCAGDAGIVQHLEDMVYPKLNNLYRGFEIREAFCDPSGVSRSPTDYLDSCIGRLNQNGIKALAASTNKYIDRRDAVAQRLTKLIDGKPAISINENCTVLIRGFRGKYAYKLKMGATGQSYTPEPDKTFESHVHDALQYVCLNFTINTIKPGKPQYDWRIKDTSFFAQ